MTIRDFLIASPLTFGCTNLTNYEFPMRSEQQCISNLQFQAVLSASELTRYHEVVRRSPSGGRGRFSGPFRLAAPPGWRGYVVCGWRPWCCRRPRRGQIHTPAGAASLHLCLMAGRGLATWTLRSSCICRGTKEWTKSTVSQLCC